MGKIEGFFEKGVKEKGYGNNLVTRDPWDLRGAREPDLRFCFHGPVGFGIGALWQCAHSTVFDSSLNGRPEDDCIILNYLLRI